jgi:hypothetical protein
MKRKPNYGKTYMFRVEVLEGSLEVIDRYFSLWGSSRREKLDAIIRNAALKEWNDAHKRGEYKYGKPIEKD